MDGGRRLLRSLKEASAAFAPARPALAGVPLHDSPVPMAPSRIHVPVRRRRKGRAASMASRVFKLLTRRGAGIVFAALLLTFAGAYGAVRGGHYDAFVANEGTIPDVIAREIGFRIKAVTMSGQTELSEGEVLAAAGIGPRNSLMFLDVAKVREQLQAVPLIKNASVRKIYPNRLLIEIEERKPTALWQKDGQVAIVSADGKVIDQLRDERFNELPFVVGEGANMRLSEFLNLLEASGDLRSKIRAGILVSNRRWTLKMTTGVEVKLPEENPAAALTLLSRMQRESRVIEKDVISLDLRQPGRVVARLSEEATAARAEMLAKKSRPKGGQT